MVKFSLIGSYRYESFPRIHGFPWFLSQKVKSWVLSFWKVIEIGVSFISTFFLQMVPAPPLLPPSPAYEENPEKKDDNIDVS